MRGNLGAYHQGRIFLNEKLEGRFDEEAFEVLHHELFHLKIERARLLNAKLGRIRMDHATVLAGQMAGDIFLSGRRLQLIEHYGETAGPDFGEECLVQLCCASMFREAVIIPPPLYKVCEALCAPFSRRALFWGGFIGSLPFCAHGVLRWPESRQILLPKAPGNLAETS